MASSPADYFAIQVVDEETSRGIPLVRLATINVIEYYTDSAGWVAFNEPALMDRNVYFDVHSHGYKIRPDGFKEPGRTLKTKPGTTAVLTMRRENIAERIYRVTGQDIYGDSVRLGLPAPIREPLLNASVTGQDSTQLALYRGKLFWVWGDTMPPTHRAAGNFRTTCGWSVLPRDGGLDPEIGIDLDYITSGSFTREMVQFPGHNLFWLSGVCVVPDNAGEEKLYALCSRIKPPLTEIERSIIRYDDEGLKFDFVTTIPQKARIRPIGHPLRVTQGDKEYFYFPGDVLTRCRATEEGLLDQESYEAYTCLKQGSDVKSRSARLDRDRDGRLVYSFKKDTAGIGQTQEAALQKAGKIKQQERRSYIVDAMTGKPVIHHAGSIYWNPWRGRWVDIFCEVMGTSLLGETWYAEADAPEGPWVYACKIVTHNTYSFYNPVQHPHFQKDEGRVVFFEGTYTREFSGTRYGTPRYDYNQIMYKLDLDGARLVIPTPVYRTATGDFRTRMNPKSHDPVFYACDLPRRDTVAVYQTGRELSLLPRAGEPPVFYALRAEDDSAATTTVCLSRKGEIQKGKRATRDTICRVWRNPVTVRLK